MQAAMSREVFKAACDLLERYHSCENVDPPPPPAPNRPRALTDAPAPDHRGTPGPDKRQRPAVVVDKKMAVRDRSCSRDRSRSSGRSSGGSSTSHFVRMGRSSSRSPTSRNFPVTLKCAPGETFDVLGKQVKELSDKAKLTKLKMNRLSNDLEAMELSLVEIDNKMEALYPNVEIKKKPREHSQTRSTTPMFEPLPDIPMATARTIKIPAVTKRPTSSSSSPHATRRPSATPLSVAHIASRISSRSASPSSRLTRPTSKRQATPTSSSVKEVLTRTPKSVSPVAKHHAHASKPFARSSSTASSRTTSSQIQPAVTRHAKNVPQVKKAVVEPPKTSEAAAEESALRHRSMTIQDSAQTLRNLKEMLRKSSFCLAVDNARQRASKEAVERSSNEAVKTPDDTKSLTETVNDNTSKEAVKEVTTEETPKRFSSEIHQGSAGKIRIQSGQETNKVSAQEATKDSVQDTITDSAHVVIDDSAQETNNDSAQDSKQEESVKDIVQDQMPPSISLESVAILEQISSLAAATSPTSVAATSPISVLWVSPDINTGAHMTQPSDTVADNTSSSPPVCTTNDLSSVTTMCLEPGTNGEASLSTDGPTEPDAASNPCEEEVFVLAFTGESIDQPIESSVKPTPDKLKHVSNSSPPVAKTKERHSKSDQSAVKTAASLRTPRHGTSMSTKSTSGHPTEAKSSTPVRQQKTKTRQMTPPVQKVQSSVAKTSAPSRPIADREATQRQKETAGKTAPEERADKRNVLGKQSVASNASRRSSASQKTAVVKQSTVSNASRRSTSIAPQRNAAVSTVLKKTALAEPEKVEASNGRKALWRS